VEEAFAQGIICEECMQLTFNQLKNRNMSPEVLSWYEERLGTCSACLRESFDDWTVYLPAPDHIKDHKEAMMLCLDCLLRDVMTLSERGASPHTLATCLSIIRKCCSCMLNNIEACIQSP
jgi:hypothetical protein